ncbi:hypothetical protein AGR4C_pb30068 [Agrobacterium tumefaciens str. Kerr 14]|uniref:Uncharacterized protein n=1 Tax=Agrobacterium tumefaciens str. Kerr 14 TaxID=1183424 RepID=A0A1S7SG80_AGRTU|nr:hypothetical protein AGR4C_pb30068 [Agrobacterium tumefaciens str. Kerr 14]
MRSVLLLHALPQEHEREPRRSEKGLCGFELEHGVEAFLDAMAAIMTERMAEQGLQLSFFDDDKESRFSVGPDR